MNIFRLPLAAGLVFVGLFACEPVEDIQTEELVDQGMLCLDSAGTLVVDLETCLSSSCDTLYDTSCSGTVDGSTLTVASDAKIDVVVNGDCTDDCGFAQITCDGIEAPADPTALTVEYAGSTTTWDQLPDCGF